MNNRNSIIVLVGALLVALIFGVLQLQTANQTQDRLTQAQSTAVAQATELDARATAAVSTLEAAQTEAAAALPVDHPEALHARMLRASSHMQRGQPVEATAVLDAIVPLMERRPDARALDLARALRLRADVAIVGGKYADASAAARRAIEFGERYLGRNHQETAASWRTLGEALQQAKHSEEAVEVSAQALERTLSAHASQPNHPWVLGARELRAKALADAGDLVPAVTELQQALAIKIAMQGESSRGVGISTHNLSGNQMRIGRLADAIANNTKALAILEQHLDADALDFVHVQNLRGMLMALVRRGDDAVTAIDRGMKATRDFLGPTHPIVLSNRTYGALGHAYAGRFATATREIDQVVADMRAAGVGGQGGDIPPGRGAFDAGGYLVVGFGLGVVLPLEEDLPGVTCVGGGQITRAGKGGADGVFVACC